MRTRKLWTFGMACICALACVGALVWSGAGLSQANNCPEQITGAIYTTEMCGEQVNGNFFTSACGQVDCLSAQTTAKGNPKKSGVIVSPYLNGGPRPHDGVCRGQHLPDGDYYFMVTDPPGKVLLNAKKEGPNWNPEDIGQRMFTVEEGRIAYYLGTTHNDAGDLSAGDCSLRISLFDVKNDCEHFRPTPNNGGVYKVWITPVCRFEEAVKDRTDLGSEAWNLAGFVPRYCKTDVFKLRDKGKPPEPVVWIMGSKFYDANGNGERDGQEGPIEHWLVRLSLNGETIDTACTDAEGKYYFYDVPPIPHNGSPVTYTISEELPDGVPPDFWQNTTPLSREVTIEPGFDGVKEVDPFGNVCLTESYCMTKGFWQNDPSNPTGGNPARDLLDSYEVDCNGVPMSLYNCMILTIPLINEDGTTFNDPNWTNGHPSRSEFQEWLCGKDVNCSLAASCLSAQLAAFWLNHHVACGVYNSTDICCPNTAIYAPGENPLGNEDIVSVEDIITAAIELVKEGEREKQIEMMTFLDNANNSFYPHVNSQPCDFTPFCPCADVSEPCSEVPIVP